MPDQDLLNITRVRLAALGQVARAGGQVTAYDLARALQPVLDLALQIGTESGRWQALRSVAIGRHVRSDTQARAAYGPGADAPGDEPPASTSPARPGRGIAPRQL